MVRRQSRPGAGIILVLIGSMLATAYFSMHIVNGRQGLEARWRLSQRAKQLRSEVAVLAAERDRLRRDIAALAGERADPDLVDEVAREVMGFGWQDDLVVVETHHRPRVP